MAQRARAVPFGAEFAATVTEWLGIRCSGSIAPGDG
jgi:hypothetical protein